MVGRYFETQKNTQKWIWILLTVTVVAFFVLFLCRKKREKKNRFQADSLEYITTGDEYMACCQNGNYDNSEGRKDS